MRAAIFLALLSTFPAGCVDIVGADIQQVVREQKHFSTTGKPEVVLSTFDGSIEIRLGRKRFVERRGRRPGRLDDGLVVIDRRLDRIVRLGRLRIWWLGRRIDRFGDPLNKRPGIDDLRRHVHPGQHYGGNQCRMASDDDDQCIGMTPMFGEAGRFGGIRDQWG